MSKKASKKKDAEKNPVEKMTAEKKTVEKKKPNEMVRLTVTLLTIAAVCSLCLGMVNAITSPMIRQIQEEKTKAAMAEVLPAENYLEVPYLSEGDIVKTIHQADDKGFVVEVVPSGFGGGITMMVGVDNDGKCTGVSIIKMTETAGLGAKASKQEFRDQFVGQTADVKVTKDGGEIDALTGATITSRAVATGVAAAIEAVKGF